MREAGREGGREGADVAAGGGERELWEQPVKKVEASPGLGEFTAPGAGQGCSP